MYCFSDIVVVGGGGGVNFFVFRSFSRKLAIFVSPAKQKRDICTAFPASLSSSASVSSAA